MKNPGSRTLKASAYNFLDQELVGIISRTGRRLKEECHLPVSDSSTLFGNAPLFASIAMSFS